MPAKVKKEGILVTPECVSPSSENLEVLGTYNPAAVRLKNNDILLYVRVTERPHVYEDNHYFYSPRFTGKDKFEITLDKFNKNIVTDHLEGHGFYFGDGTVRLNYISYLKKVIIDQTGFNVRYIDNKPTFYGTCKNGELSIEDPRITKISNKYIMTYVSLSRYGNISTKYAVSTDCNHWHQKDIIFAQQNKDVVLFPEKIYDKYVAFNRPEGNFQFSMPHMWLSYSPDLEYWGNSHPIILSKEKSWDSFRVGAGAPPVKTRYGWLLIYHGVKRVHIDTDATKGVKNFFKIPYEYKNEYCAGAALFDLKNPCRLIAKSPPNKPLLTPTKTYEKIGFMNDVIFPSGAILTKDKKDLLIFSGAADRVTTVKQISLKEIFKNLKKV